MAHYRHIRSVAYRAQASARQLVLLSHREDKDMLTLTLLGLSGLLLLLLGLGMCILGKRDDQQMDRELREFLERIQ